MRNAGVLDLRWNGERYQARVFVTSTAPPQRIYPLLAEPLRHLEWTSTRQRPEGGLLAIDAPPGTAAVGAEFRSEGLAAQTGLDAWLFPRARFHNHNVVSEARAPLVFAFTTEWVLDYGTARPASHGLHLHRFELQAREGGSTLSYSFTRERFTGVPWLVRLPLVAQFRHLVLQPRILIATCRRIAAAAEEQA